MNIAIIGAGNVGGTLATKWSGKGHNIYIGAKDTAKFQGNKLLENSNTTVHSIHEAVNLSEVILVATPPEIAIDLTKEFGNTNGKTIIDATNTIMKSPEPYPTAFHAFEDLTEAEVVKCFNTTGFENMKNPNYGNITLDMYMGGSSESAKQIAISLSKDAEFENCYDFGLSDKVELLEKFALSWINLAIFQGMGRDIGFKLVSR